MAQTELVHPSCREISKTRCELVGTIEGAGYEKTLEKNRRVYSVSGVSPTVVTRADSDYGVLIMEDKCKCIGTIEGGGYETALEENRRVYSPEGISPTVTTRRGGRQEVKIMESDNLQRIDVPQIVKVRKYSVDTEKLGAMLRTHKALTNKQIAEKLNVPITNVEHWFRRDEYFSIPDAEIWFQLKELLGIKTDEFDASITEFEEREGVFEQGNRVYHEDGISPTVMAETNNGIRIATNNKQGYAEINDGDFVNLQYASSSTRRGRIGEQIAQTLCCTDEQGVAVEAPFAYDEQNGYARSDGTVGTLTTNGSSPKHNNRVVVPDEENNSRIQESSLRIRKLTPLECWRLMDFDDEDYYKAQAIESNTQLYAQAGNSIVVNVLTAIFGQMFDGKEDIYKEKSG